MLTFRASISPRSSVGPSVLRANAYHSAATTLSQPCPSYRWGSAPCLNICRAGGTRVMAEASRAPIVQANPKAGYLAQQAEIDAALTRAARSGWYILGAEVEAFEREFAAYLGVAHVVGVANGTDAIELALRACGVGPSDLVFTVSHTAVATVTAVERIGAIPVLVDI